MPSLPYDLHLFMKNRRQKVHCWRRYSLYIFVFRQIILSWGHVLNKVDYLTVINLNFSFQENFPPINKTNYNLCSRPTKVKLSETQGMTIKNSFLLQVKKTKLFVYQANLDFYRGTHCESCHWFNTE